MHKKEKKNIVLIVYCFFTRMVYDYPTTFLCLTSFEILEWMLLPQSYTRVVVNRVLCLFMNGILAHADIWWEIRANNVRRLNVCFRNSSRFVPDSNVRSQSTSFRSSTTQLLEGLPGRLRHSREKGSELFFVYTVDFFPFRKVTSEFF